jgi:predicted Zn-dependent protease
MRQFLIACLVVVLFACESSDPTAKYSIEPGLEVHVNTFFQEASARGIVLPQENLVVRLRPQSEFNDQGRFTTEGNQRIITIQTELYQYYTSDGCKNYYDNSYCYNRLEILMFHELGHALLGREHTDGESYMSTEFITPVIPYEEEQRTALINELFSNQ